MLIANLADPATHSRRRGGFPSRVLHRPRSETQEIAECFIAARTRADSLVAFAYQQLEEQRDRQFAALKAVLLDGDLLKRQSGLRATRQDFRDKALVSATDNHPEGRSDLPTGTY